jgi:hypothetical protein
LCLRKSKKRRNINQSNGVLGAKIWAKLSPREALAGQKDRTRSNWCIKERNKGPYLDPKRASKKPQWGPLGPYGSIGVLSEPPWRLLGGSIPNLRGPFGAFRASSGPLGSPIRALRGPHYDP